MMRQLRSIRWSVTRPVLLSLVVSLVLTRLDYGSVILASLPRTQRVRFQSVLNAVALLVKPTRRGNMIISHPYFASYIGYECQSAYYCLPYCLASYFLAVVVYCPLHGQGPQYLTAELHRTLDRDTGRRMHSSSTASLVVPRTKHSTIGERAFPVAAVRVWNSLSQTVTSSTSLLTFQEASCSHDHMLHNTNDRHHNILERDLGS